MNPKPRPTPDGASYTVWCARLQIQAPPEVCRANKYMGKKPCQTCDRGRGEHDAARPKVL